MADAARQEAASSQTIYLVSSEDLKLAVDTKAACISTLVRNAVMTDHSVSEVKVAVNGKILQKIVNYMSYHAGVEAEIPEMPLRSKNFQEVCKDPFDSSFIDSLDDRGANRQQLYDLIIAANYLDIRTLLHLGCAKVATLIKNQPVENMKDALSGTKF
jgi:S-phase kinase-associated protein 1